MGDASAAANQETKAEPPSPEKANLLEREMDVNEDANNYMRSKAEIRK